MIFILTLLSGEIIGSIVFLLSVGLPLTLATAVHDVDELRDELKEVKNKLAKFEKDSGNNE